MQVNWEEKYITQLEIYFPRKLGIRSITLVIRPT